MTNAKGMEILTLLICIFIKEHVYGDPYKLSNKLNHQSSFLSPAGKTGLIKPENSDAGPLIRYQAQEDNGYYKFGYAVADGQYRVEEGSPEEGILGSYGYISPNGKEVKVFYKADQQGFQILTSDLYKILTEARKGFGHRNGVPSAPRPAEPPSFFPYPDSGERQPGFDVYPVLPPEIPQNDTNVVFEGTNDFGPIGTPAPEEPDIDPNEEVDVISGPGTTFGYVPQPGFTPGFGGQYPGFGPQPGYTPNFGGQYPGFGSPQPQPPPLFPGNQNPLYPPFYYVPQSFTPGLRQKYRFLPKNQQAPIIIKI